MTSDGRAPPHSGTSRLDACQPVHCSGPAASCRAEAESSAPWLQGESQPEGEEASVAGLWDLQVHAEHPSRSTRRACDFTGQIEFRQRRGDITGDLSASGVCKAGDALPTGSSFHGECARAVSRAPPTCSRQTIPTGRSAAASRVTCAGARRGRPPEPWPAAGAARPALPRRQLDRGADPLAGLGHSVGGGSFRFSFLPALHSCSGWMTGVAPAGRSSRDGGSDDRGPDGGTRDRQQHRPAGAPAFAEAGMRLALGRGGTDNKRLRRTCMRRRRRRHGAGGAPRCRTLGVACACRGPVLVWGRRRVRLHG